MPRNNTPNAEFSEWYSDLTDDDQCMVLDVLKLLAMELGISLVVVGCCNGGSQAPTAEHALNTHARVSTQFSLN